LVHEGCNKASRFLEVAVEVDGGWKGTIWIPKGRKGWGWRHFVSEMRKLKEVQGGQFKPTIDEYPSLPGKWVEVKVFDSSGYHYGRSFVNVLRSTAGRLKSMSSCLLDVFPVSECFEAELGGVEQRITVDCYAMEAEQISSKELVVVPSPALLSLVAAEWMKTNGWVMFHLGLFGMSGLFAGLGLKPKGSQIRVRHRLDLGLVHGFAPDPVPDPIPDLGSDPIPDPVADTGFLSVSSSDFTLEVPVHTGIKPDHADDPLSEAKEVFDPSPLGDESMGSDGSLGSDGALGSDGSLGAGTVLLGVKTLDFTDELSVPSSRTLSSDTIVDVGLTKSQNWLLASLRKAVQDDAMHLALMKDMEESWRQARKDVCVVLSTEEEDRNLASLKDEIEWFIGGRKGPQTRSKGKREHRRVVRGMGKNNVGWLGRVVWVLLGGRS
jgi:hypothetical protein